jgi:glycosyltransferase involved in cell wall biosynthesis
VVAVNEGGPSTLIDDGRTGLLRPPVAEALAEAVVKLAASPAWRTHLAWTAAASARERTWERSLDQLASGYRAVLEPATAAGERRAA